MGSYTHQWSASVICFNQLRGMDLVSWFPYVVALQVALPFEEILKLSGPSMILVAADLLHFVLLFALNEVRWRLGKVWAMSGHLVIG
jgi:hypothetical protein